MTYLMDLTSRRVLVTGGGTGIGRAIALGAAAKGAHVFVSGRRESPLVETTDAIRSASKEARAGFHAVDLTKEGGPRQLVTEAVAFLGGLDTLVVNAGFGLKRFLEDFTGQEIDDIIAVNLTAAIKTTQAAVHELKKAAAERPGADLVLISSTAGTLGFAGGSIYGAAEWGLRGFGKSLQEELKPSGIRVTIVYPGSTDTEFFDRFPAGLAREAMLRPDEVAAPILAVLAARPDVLFEELTIRPRVVKQ